MSRMSGKQQLWMRPTEASLPCCFTFGPSARKSESLCGVWVSSYDKYTVVIEPEDANTLCGKCAVEAGLVRPAPAAVPPAPTTKAKKALKPKPRQRAGY